MREASARMVRGAFYRAGTKGCRSREGGNRVSFARKSLVPAFAGTTPAVRYNRQPHACRTSRATREARRSPRARSSVGKSRGLIILWSLVRIQPGPLFPPLRLRLHADAGRAGRAAHKPRPVVAIERHFGRTERETRRKRNRECDDECRVRPLR